MRSARPALSTVQTLIVTHLERLRIFLDKSTPDLTKPEGRALATLAFIVSLLCENCDFDLLSDEREGS